MGYAGPAHQATGINIAKIRILGLLDAVGGHDNGSRELGKFLCLVLPGSPIMTMEMGIFFQFRVTMTGQHLAMGINVNTLAGALLQDLFKVFQIMA